MEKQKEREEQLESEHRRQLHEVLQAEQMAHNKVDDYYVHVYFLYILGD